MKRPCGPVEIPAPQVPPYESLLRTTKRQSCEHRICATLHGAASRSLYTIELCAGSAGLTAEIIRAGFNGIPVDHKTNLHVQRAACLVIDLTRADSWVLLVKLLDTGRVLYVHSAPPCGTASRARERPLPNHATGKFPEPKPLRTNNFPEGKPDLECNNLIKVQQANAIYEHTAAFLARCHGAGVKFSIENPTNSIMWLTKWMQPLLAMDKVSGVKFQQCRWGGKRGKWSSWYTNWPQLHDLAGSCPGGHAHLPWGAVFKGKNYSVATAAETEYPRDLCTKIAALLKSEAFEMGIHVVEAANPPTKQSGFKSGPRLASKAEATNCPRSSQSSRR